MKILNKERAYKKDNYTWISIKIIDGMIGMQWGTGSTFQVLWVIIYLTSYPRTAPALVTLKYIMKMTKLSKSTVLKALKELRKRNIIIKHGYIYHKGRLYSVNTNLEEWDNRKHE